jgi:hypothetical protein
MADERDFARHRLTYEFPEGLFMLAEKFFLLLEALLKNQSYADGSPRVISTSPHVPVKLPEPK